MVWIIVCCFCEMEMKFERKDNLIDEFGISNIFKYYKYRKILFIWEFFLKFMFYMYKKL